MWLLAFASPVARRFGARRFLLFFAVTIAAGALAYLLAHAGALAPMIGASAGISGMMGAAARFAFEPGGSLDMWHGDRANADRVPAAPLSVALRNPRVLTFVGVWFGLNLLFGLGSVSFVDRRRSERGMGGPCRRLSRRTLAVLAVRSGAAAPIADDQRTLALAAVNRLPHGCPVMRRPGQEP